MAPRINVSAQQSLAQACQRLLRPLVRILLRNGVPYRDFSEIAKTVYTEIARESFTPEGKRPTDARVATLTGLTRKDVKRLREQGDESYGERGWGGANRATRVLSGWHRDPDFTDAHGAPRVLAMDADDGFTALVRRYSGDIPANAILEELERVLAVRRSEDGQLHVLNRAFVPEADDPESIRMLGTASHDLLSTIEYNLARPEGAQPYFQRSAFDTRLDPRMLPVFHRLVSQNSQQLLELLDDWMEKHEIDDAIDHATDGDDGQARGARAGVGIYYFQDRPPDGSDES